MNIDREDVEKAVEDAEEEGTGLFTRSHPLDPEEDIVVLILTGYYASFGRETVAALWSLLEEAVDTP